MRLSEFKDEKAIEVIADLLEPAEEIISNPANKEAAQKIREGKNGKMKFATAMLKNNRSAVMKMLAVLHDTPIEKFHCNAASLIKDLYDMLTDEEILLAFGLQGQESGEESSGSATENITADSDASTS